MSHFPEKNIFGPTTSQTRIYGLRNFLSYTPDHPGFHEYQPVWVTIKQLLQNFVVFKSLKSHYNSRAVFLLILTKGDSSSRKASRPDGGGRPYVLR